MDIIIKEQNGVIIAKIKGKFDGTSAPKAQEELIKLIKPKVILVIDMKDCDFISSAGLRVLLMIAKNLSSHGGKGAISGLSEDLKDIMGMTGFDHIFQNYDNVDMAIMDIK